MGSLIRSGHEFERKWHRFEQVTWVLLLLILFAAVTGTLGRGAAASRTAVAPDGSLSVVYDRVLRSRTTVDLEVIVEAKGTGSGKAEFAFKSAIPVRQTDPQPAESVARRDDMVMRFVAEPNTPARVRFTQAPASPGRYRSTIGSVEIEQIILP